MKMIGPIEPRASRERVKVTFDTFGLMFSAFVMTLMLALKAKSRPTRP